MMKHRRADSPAAERTIVTTIKAVIRDRHLELDVPADWPDGTEVEIRPLLHSNLESEFMSPEEIAQALAAMDQVIPFDMTEAEEEAWEAERLARKELEKSEFCSHAEKLRQEWK
jgi:hypothetical protein